MVNNFHLAHLLMMINSLDLVQDLQITYVFSYELCTSYLDHGGLIGIYYSLQAPERSYVVPKSKNIIAMNNLGAHKLLS